MSQLIAIQSLVSKDDDGTVVIDLHKLEAGLQTTLFAAIDSLERHPGPESRYVVCQLGATLAAVSFANELNRKE